MTPEKWPTCVLRKPDGMPCEIDFYAHPLAGRIEGDIPPGETHHGNPAGELHAQFLHLVKLRNGLLPVEEHAGIRVTVELAPVLVDSKLIQSSSSWPRGIEGARLSEVAGNRRPSADSCPKTTLIGARVARPPLTPKFGFGCALRKACLALDVGQKLLALAGASE